jgi:hypothetical protein
VALTSVRTPLEHIASNAVDMLLNPEINNNMRITTPSLFPVSLPRLHVNNPLRSSPIQEKAGRVEFCITDLIPDADRGLVCDLRCIFNQHGVDGFIFEVQCQRRENDCRNDFTSVSKNRLTVNKCLLIKGIFMINIDLRGLTPAPVTPFTRDGRVDYDAIQRLGSWLGSIDGVKGLVVLGHAGEGLF